MSEAVGEPGWSATPAICSSCAPPSTSSVRWCLPHDARSVPEQI
jgi:hypothetical protein